MDLGKLLGGIGFSSVPKMAERGMFGIGGKLMTQSPRFASMMMPMFAPSQDQQNMMQFGTGIPMNTIKNNASQIGQAVMPSMAPNDYIAGYGASNFPTKQAIPITGLF